MTKDLSKMYEIRSASSMVEKRPTDNTNETIRTLFLLDDILKIKGHPKSKEHCDETPYGVHMRHIMLMELMKLNTSRQFKFGKYKRSYLGIMAEHTGIIKPIDANITEKRYKEWSKIFHNNRQERFYKKLQQLIEPATGSTLDLKIKYGSLIPRPELFEGKGRLIGKNIWVKRPIQWSLHARDLYFGVKCLGEVSQRALEVINSSGLSMGDEFDVVEEWKKVPYKVSCNDPQYKGEKICWKSSDVKRQVRVVIEYCRY